MSVCEQVTRLGARCNWRTRLLYTCTGCGVTFCGRHFYGIHRRQCPKKRGFTDAYVTLAGVTP